MKKNYLAILNFVLLAQLAEARNMNSGVQTVIADSRMIALSIGIMFIIVAGVITFTNMQAGVAKYLAVIVGIVMIVTATGAVAYFSGSFG